MSKRLSKATGLFLAAVLITSTIAQASAASPDTQTVSTDSAPTTSSAAASPSTDTTQTPASANTSATPAGDTAATDSAATSSGLSTPTVPTTTQTKPSSPKTSGTLSQTTSSSSGLTPTQINAPGAKQVVPQPDPSTGALTYSYPIKTPPGRNGIQPDLNLIYNSQNPSQDSAFGYGWSISIPYISRVNKTGTDQLYSSNYFTSSLSGDLILVSGSTYAPRVENGDFLKYTFASNTWTVTDKKGTVYTFGSQAATRQDNPNDSTQIFKWMLEKVQDTNGNFISYTYFKDAGQIYPSSIVYTNNGLNAGIFEVDFLRQTRTDAAMSYSTAFLVTSHYVVNEIDAKTSGAVTRKYILAFATGDNSARSILSTVTESGTDEVSGITTTLPTVTLTHNKNASTGWSNSHWSWPTDAVPDFYTGSTIVADINGDGLPDIMRSTNDANGITTQKTYLNNGDGTWTLSTAYTPPTIFYAAPGGQGQNYGVIALDVNGDGLPDLIGGWNTGPLIWLNTGSGWTAGAPSYYYAAPLGLSSSTGDTGTRIADLNGDGLPDFFESEPDGSGGIIANVYLNNGSGFGSDVGASWTFPYVTNTHSAGGNPRVIFADLNGDGIADIFYVSIDQTNGAVTKDVYLGTGIGTFVETPAFIPGLDLSFFGAAIITNPGIVFADVNGDGIPDAVLAVSWGGILHTQTLLGTGNGWISTTSWNSPVQFADGTYSNAAFIDTNASGLAGIYTGNGIYFNNGAKTDLLNKITYSQGGSATVTYKPVSFYKSGTTSLNPGFPLMLQTAQQVVLDDGSGNQATSTYTYAGASYYLNQTSPLDRKFAGFATITKTDAVGNTTKTFFHQANAANAALGEYNDNFWKIGKVYRIEVADPSRNLFAKTINRWDDFDQGSTNHFVKLAQTVEYAYDGLATHKDKAEVYSYDNTTGNLTQKAEYGQVTGNDDGSFTGTARFTTNYTYASGGNVIGLPDDVVTTDQNSNKVKETKYLYDNQAFGAVTSGNLTEQDDWITGSTYAAQKKIYDGTYGLVTQSKDPNSNATNYSFDPNNLYPATVTDPLNHQTQYTYDYSSGQVRQTTDPNGRIFVNKYDGLDRLIETDQPDLSTPTTLVAKLTYTYTDTAGAVSVTRVDYLDSSNTVSSYTYYDGLNRKLQERKTESGSNYQIKDYVYGNLGLLQKESLPYFGSGSSKSAPTTTSALYISYVYDPLYRITATSNSIGTTTNTYANWKLTVTDANGKSKDSFKDAFGNLIEVDEHNAGSTYVTTYTYDYLGDLLKITDANGNVRNFTYDGLGRRLSSQDLHTPSAVTISTWNYTYDNNGNLLRTVDPNGNTINYTFDFLNRKLTEGTSALGLQVTNGYDSGTDGVGRLTSVTAPSYTQSLSYNPLGYLSSETKTISNTGYTTTYTYNRQGQQLIISNPDGSQVQYVYDAGGLVAKVQHKESTDSGFSGVVSSFTYSPTERVATEQFANGSTTTNTYDPTKLYRLTNKQTVAGVPPQYQPPATLPVYGPSSSWSQITLPNPPLYGPQQKVISLLTDPTSSSILYVGTYDDGLWKSTDMGKTWTQLFFNGDAYEVPVISLAMDPENHLTIYAARGARNDVSSWTPILYKSTDGGNNWTNITGTLPTSSTNIRNIIVDPSNSNNIYVSDDSSGFYKSTNGGSTWNQIFNQANISSAAINPATPSTLYFGFGSHLYRSTNGGSSWNQVYSGNIVTAITVDPLNPNIALAGINTTTQNAVIKSTDGGTTWQQGPAISNGFDNDMLVNPLNDQNVFGTSNSTPYASYDGGNSWGILGGTINALGSGALAFDKNLAIIYLGVKNTNNAGLSSGLYFWVIGNQSTAPVINTFGAGPSWVTSGHSTTLYWTMSGGTPTSLSIDQGVGSVLNSGSVLVSPTVQTIYTLTATNAAGTATAQVTVMVNPPQRQNISYTYDNVGNITQIVDSSNTDTAKTVTYTYDDLYRLTSATATNVAAGQSTYTENYSYDPVGNITSKTGQGTYTYAGTGQPDPDAVTSIGSATYTYDNNGNLLTAGTALSNTWDYNNRLTQAVSGTKTDSYTYDENGERLSLGNGTTTQVYPTSFYNTDGTTPVKHIFANGVEVATITGTGTGASVNSDFTDHLTGSNVITDSNGNVVETEDYMPFGSIRFDEKTGAFSEQRKFAGHEYDGDTALSYQNARYYNPAAGRWLSEDPIYLELGGSQFTNDFVQSFVGTQYRDLNKTALLNNYLANPQTLNPYTYVGDDPVRYTDPNGKFVQLLMVPVLGYAAGDLSEYLSNVEKNISNDTTWYQNHSSARDYRDAGIEGAATATGTLFGGPWGGGAAYLGTAAIIDHREHKNPFSAENLATTAVTIATEGIIEGFPKVRGPVPDTLSKSLVQGAHATYQYTTAAISVATDYSIHTLKDIFNKLRHK